MIFRTILGFIVVLVGCSGNHQPSKSGLRIDNGPNQGLNYTDPDGTRYSYRYLTTTITNDSTLPFHLQIALSNEYDFPDIYGDQKFRAFLLPKELTSDQVTFDTLTYELGHDELRKYFDRGLNPPYVLNETLNPGEKCVITMGTLYPRPTNCGIVPNVLFAQSDRGLYHECDSLINQDISTNPPLALVLKLDFCTGCAIIPCGQISFPDH